MISVSSYYYYKLNAYRKKNKIIIIIIMVVETCGAWGKEATAIISSVASRLATSMCRPKSIVLNEVYGQLNLHWSGLMLQLSSLG